MKKNNPESNGRRCSFRWMRKTRHKKRTNNILRKTQPNDSTRLRWEICTVFWVLKHKLLAQSEIEREKPTQTWADAQYKCGSSTFAFFLFPIRAHIYTRTHTHICSKMDFIRVPLPHTFSHSFGGGVIKLRIHLIAVMVDVSRSVCMYVCVRRFTFMLECKCVMCSTFAIRVANLRTGEIAQPSPSQRRNHHHHHFYRHRYCHLVSPPKYGRKNEP